MSNYLSYLRSYTCKSAWIGHKKLVMVKELCYFVKYTHEKLYCYTHGTWPS
jgi:hypothetical protein